MFGQDTVDSSQVRNYSPVGGALSGMLIQMVKPSFPNFFESVKPEEDGEEDGGEWVRYSILQQGEDMQDPRAVRRSSELGV